MTQTAMIPVASITVDDVKMRDVIKKSAKVAEMIDSVRQQGILNAISVEPTSSHDGFEYLLCDGLHRLTAAAEAGLEMIPCVVFPPMTKSERLVRQLVANSHKVETAPAQMAAQLLRISSQNPLMTNAELAKLISRSEDFVKKYLMLNRIEDQDIRSAIDAGEIKVGNAHALAALAHVAPEELDNYVSDAKILPPSEFLPVVEERIREIKADKAKGRGKAEAGFKMIPRPRPPKILKDFYEAPETLAPIIGTETEPMEAVKAFVAWMVRCDAASTEAAKAKYDEEKARREAAREGKTIDKAKEQYEKAKKQFEELQKADQEALDAAQ